MPIPNPIYDLSNSLPLVFASAMASLYAIALLVTVGKALLVSTHKLWPPCRLRSEPSWPFDGKAIVYTVTCALYAATATAIYYHASTPTYKWLETMLGIHAIIMFFCWGMFRFPSVEDMIVMLMTSLNLFAYLASLVTQSLKPYMDDVQSVTMYVLMVTMATLLIKRAIEIGYQSYRGLRQTLRSLHR